MTAEIIEQGSHALVITEPDEKRSITIMDRMDLDQAMAELQGTVIETFVYVARGKRQLSYAGIKEAARLYRNVHFGATATPLAGGEGWMITSYAHNLADNTRVDYPMPYPPFDAGDPEESIAFRATLSKSIRNALAAVLPVTYLQTMISRWLEQQAGVRPTAPPPRVQQARRSDPAEEVLTEEQAEMLVLREELAQWFARYPDTGRAAQALLAKEGKTRHGDNRVREMVARLRARAAKEDQRATLQAAESAVVDAIPPESRLASAVELGRRLLTTVAGRPHEQPTAGDMQAARALLTEIQAVAPLSGDEPASRLETFAVVPALFTRIMAENEQEHGQAQDTARDDDDTPDDMHRLRPGEVPF